MTAAADRSLLPEDTEPVHAFAREYFPLAATDTTDHRVCLYTATDDWNFIIDRWPASDHVVIAGGLSGHGFKFAPALGRVVSDMVLDDADGPPQFRLR